MLAFGLMLRDKLEKTGKYRVAMTRSDDTFIPLDERVRFARARKAVIVSLDPSELDPRTEARRRAPRSTRCPHTPPTREAARLAEVETNSDVIAGVDLSPSPTMSPIS